MADTADKSQQIVDLVKSRTAGDKAKAIDGITTSAGIGSIDTSITSSFYGINHRQTPGAIQINKDYFGLTFFTRPKLNLSGINLRSDRLMAPLLTQEENSLQRAIRCTLDPRLDTGEASGIPCGLIDPKQAFIPLLTNHLMASNGWPDLLAPTATSHEGMYKEAFSFVDGLTKNHSTYDISAQFRNIPGDPITALFFTWLHYMSLVYEGVMVPYLQAIVERETDYHTRIYRLVLDSSKTRVTKIAACGAAFPISCPIGAAFNYEAGKPINSSNDQINVQFRCMGAIYQDDILIYEFNRTVATFNPEMRESNFLAPGANNTRGSYTNRTMQQIPIEALTIFNNMGYARINPVNYELEWWVRKSDYKAVLPG